jgi:hypothetical protein
VRGCSTSPQPVLRRSTPWRLHTARTQRSPHLRIKTAHLPSRRKTHEPVHPDYFGMRNFWLTQPIWGRSRATGQLSARQPARCASSLTWAYTSPARRTQGRGRGVGVGAEQVIGGMTARQQGLSPDRSDSEQDLQAACGAAGRSMSCLRRRWRRRRSRRSGLALLAWCQHQGDDPQWVTGQRQQVAVARRDWS